MRPLEEGQAAGTQGHDFSWDMRGEILGTASRKDVLESGLAGVEGVNVEVIPNGQSLAPTFERFLRE